MRKTSLVVLALLTSTMGIAPAIGASKAKVEQPASEIRESTDPAKAAEVEQRASEIQQRQAAAEQKASSGSSGTTHSKSGKPHKAKKKSGAEAPASQ